MYCRVSLKLYDIYSDKFVEVKIKFVLTNIKFCRRANYDYFLV